MCSRRVPYRKFSQYVRKFNPDRLLQKVAQTSADLEGEAIHGRPSLWAENGPVQQFSLAFVARTAIIGAGDRRKKQPDIAVTDSDLAYLCAQAIELDHEGIPDVGIPTSRGFTRMHARLIYHQGLFRYSDFENLTRTFGLLIQDGPSVRRLPSAQQWKETLGVPLQTYVAIVFHLASLAVSKGGFLLPGRHR